MWRREVWMSDTGPESGTKGIVEDVKGKTKQVAGEIVGNEKLAREGEAQQSDAL